MVKTKKYSMRYSILIILAIAVLISAFALNQKDRAQQVVDQAIKEHGSDLVDQAFIEFDFRRRHYISDRNHGSYTYKRIFEDKDENKIEDVLTNDGFSRFINGERVNLEQKRATSYSSSVNSVIYFALLPFFLNDQAVIKSYLGEEVIKGERYHKVKVTFRQEGGGKDYDDQYMYWFHKKNATMDYMAYNFHVNGGGSRFREAYNIRMINGIRFADYINYKPKEQNLNIEGFASMFENDELEELSRIQTENIKVEIHQE
jgi:hypothetical protein